jgi:hypothetical protein
MPSREDVRKAFYDTVYEVWRRGGNSDAVDYENVSEAVYNGGLHHGVDEREIRRVTRRRIPDSEPEQENDE